MKKLEQTILIVMIITCVGMCFGSVLIAFTRLDNEKPKDPNPSDIQNIVFQDREEIEINLILNQQLYPALMHGREFSVSSFSRNFSFLKNEEDQFYFVFELLKIKELIDISCHKEEELNESRCQMKEYDFQNYAKQILGRTINWNLIENNKIVKEGEMVFCDEFLNKQKSFQLRFSTLTRKGENYLLTLQLYTSVQDEKINYSLIESWGNTDYISQKYLYGSILIQYKMVEEQKVITTISYEKL